MSSLSSKTLRVWFVAAPLCVISLVVVGCFVLFAQDRGTPSQERVIRALSDTGEMQVEDLPPTHFQPIVLRYVDEMEANASLVTVPDLLQQSLSEEEVVIFRGN
ncbi:MAG: hypothetical protein KDA96_04065 [Planctomycetaceae bacterium]|nr:hypothetical protein [Planctomycetaceae bacterium]